MTINSQKEFVREYRLAVLDEAESILSNIEKTASQKDFEQDIFMEDVLRMVKRLAYKEDANE